VLQCVAACCSLLQCVEVHCKTWNMFCDFTTKMTCEIFFFVTSWEGRIHSLFATMRGEHSVAVYCSVLQCVAVCCNVLLLFMMMRGEHSGAVCCSVLQCAAVCCSVLPLIAQMRGTHSVAVCCMVLQGLAVCCSVLQCVVMFCDDAG